MDDIVSVFLTVRNQIKLYHWKTGSYSRHKATDKFVELFDENVDKFVEVMIGNRDSKPNDGFKITFEKLTDKNVTEYLHKFRDWLTNTLPDHLLEHETDLMNIRDEILADVNRLLYLFKLK